MLAKERIERKEGKEGQRVLKLKSGKDRSRGKRLNLMHR